MGDDQQAASAAAGLTYKKRKSDDSSSDEDSQDGLGPSGGEDSGGKLGEGNSNLDRLRRQKRLAMNRESARNRRKRKKMLLETLEKQVEEMNQVNTRLRTTNEALTARVTQLESELTMSKSTIAMITGSQHPLLGPSGFGGGGGDPLSLLAQRQGLGFGFGGPRGAEPSALQYMQLMQGGRGPGADSDFLRFGLARERQLAESSGQLPEGENVAQGGLDFQRQLASLRQQAGGVGGAPAVAASGASSGEGPDKEAASKLRREP